MKVDGQAFETQSKTWSIPSWQPATQAAPPKQHWAGAFRIVIEGSWADAAEAEWAEEAAAAAAVAGCVKEVMTRIKFIAHFEVLAGLQTDACVSSFATTARQCTVLLLGFTII